MDDGSVWAPLVCVTLPPMLGSHDQLARVLPQVLLEQPGQVQQGLTRAQLSQLNQALPVEDEQVSAGCEDRIALSRLQLGHAGGREVTRKPGYHVRHVLILFL